MNATHKRALESGYYYCDSCIAPHATSTPRHCTQQNRNASLRTTHSDVSFDNSLRPLPRRFPFPLQATAETREHSTHGKRSVSRRERSHGWRKEEAKKVRHVKPIRSSHLPRALPRQMTPQKRIHVSVSKSDTSIPELIRPDCLARRPQRGEKRPLELAGLTRGCRYSLSTLSIPNQSIEPFQSDEFLFVGGSPRGGAVR